MVCQCATPRLHIADLIATSRLHIVRPALRAAHDYRRRVDLNTVEEVVTPHERADLWPMAAGDSVLAGGTWLFSEPQPHLRRLIDLNSLRWPPITLSDNGIELAATCPLLLVSQLSHQLPQSHATWA